ncbi:MAG: TetR/AcrR family transcriptional regulator [Pseudomonadota bacterium]
MTKRDENTIERDDPDAVPRVGHVKVTRRDWLNAARDVLVEDGVLQVKVLLISTRLGVSRSSFYWYFENRDHLLEELLGQWRARNTKRITAACAAPAACINEGACNFFRCFIDPNLFDRGLDFAVREWARRDVDVRAQIEAADAERLAAITGMFVHHGFAPFEADWRARMIYFMQLGYHALDVREPMELRMARLPGFLEGFTGRKPPTELVEKFTLFAMKYA